ADRNRSHWSTSKTPSYTKSVSWQHHQQDENDDKLQQLRRLLAMAISRARNSVVIGYKESEKSDLVKYFTPGTFDEIDL
ncbi:hypothetical protein NP183_22845, partial [Salmonella enterica]|nr:hypothetical protein [Salmonella enterica]